MNTVDPIHDHALAIVFEGITDPVKRTTFFRANKAALARESERVRTGKPLPALPRIENKAEPFPMGLTVKVGGKVVRHIPHRYVTAPTGGLFGQSIRR